MSNRPKLRRRTRIDHETGNIHVPGKGDLPLIGPTSGAAYEDLKRMEDEHKERMLELQRMILSEYQCTQCKRKQSGALLRPKTITLEGVQTNVLVCSDPKCSAPVVMIRDARDVRQIPGGE